MLLSLLLAVPASARNKTSLDIGWKFKKDQNTQNCTKSTFPVDLTNLQCFGLQQATASSADECLDACCKSSGSNIWQWCTSSDCGEPNACWIGVSQDCREGPGWVGAGRQGPEPGPAPGDKCQVPECDPSTADTAWRTLNLPHDFVVEGDFDPRADVSHGYLPYGTGWYRLHFNVSSSLKGQSIWIDFDGVQRNSQIYLNGICLGTHDSGFTSFRFNLGSDNPYAVLKYGAENVLAVFVDATGPDSWWYDGGGIYRHVWLYTADSLHIAPWGLYLPSAVDITTITTSDALTDTENAGGLVGDAVVSVMASVNNKRVSTASFDLDIRIFNASGVIVAQSNTSARAVGGTQAFVNFSVGLPNANLWSVERPYLYRVSARVLEDGRVVDEVDERIGVRSLRWDVDQGLFLNEQHVKIHGMANHQDFAGLGVAIPDNLQEFRVRRLKEMGCNGWRTAHNPPTPELLDAADRLGMLVWDENHRNLWEGGQWLADMDSLILRDRNHPSIVIWSICNEVLCENFDADHASVLKQRAKMLDPLGGRVVSAAMNGAWDSPFSAVLDLTGFNYNPGQYDVLKTRYPNWKFIGSETASDVSDRGVYENDPVAAYVSAYDVNHPEWATTSQNGWCPVYERSWLIGSFVWTGFDYKGEPTPYKWPNINSHFGVIDIAGNPKDNFYYYQSVWTAQPMVHVFPHWNWDQVKCAGICRVQNGAKIVNVWAYTNGDAVELLVNGVSQGVLNYTVCRHVEWNVTYSAGEITAIAYNKGVVHAKKTVQTTGPVTGVKLIREFPSGTSALRADGMEAALILVQLVDDNDRVVPTAAAPIEFSITGAAHIIGLGNGDPSSHEHDKPATPTSGSRSAWNGLARVVVQSSGAGKRGNATLLATSPALKKAQITLSFA